MISDGGLRERLATAWGLDRASVEIHNGGMNSATWFVGQDGVRWVAKAVAPAARGSFTAGLAVAAALDQAGIAAGAPVPTRDGEVVVEVAGIPLALLTWVPGEELTGSEADQRLIGATLARVHRALRHVSVPGTEHFHWVDPHAAHLGVRPWVRGAVTAAVEAYDRLAPRTLTWGLLHTDPSPEAFRLAAGTCGLLDWSVAMKGPFLYDLASAVMYTGGTACAAPLIESYLADGPIPRPEAERALAVMVRFRWAVQADYFARRIATDDLTGIADATGNEKGLADAYAALRPYNSVSTGGCCLGG
ncbi:hypothetical protein GCM10010168_17640 [Actinoplanes ianthinogenes]|uniref:Aminoglycoside phosphotransferase domain-containing protein n=1 Tax=Actinoplanes ianthinogenes TaxID=122358 RepID=A0ABM7M707_9ACTN|nr:phosphotransferase [Actinoplanes ianthinogenes]BCJ47406.1 hypothetical protein Aiant_80630 [Actinoplanes ianthinogenes]GGR01597.1 hypothetical protein GCM10010168_17640 [Actinoplanes ianthinogenes]